MFQRVYSQHIQVRISALHEGFSKWKKLYYDLIKKINFNLRFSQSLVEIHYWNLYSKKIIVLGFHLVVRTVNPVFLCFRSSYSQSLHVRESRAVLDSGIHAEDSGFQVLDSRICQWNLDFGFQSLVGFRIPWTVLRIPNPRIPDPISIIFPDSGIRIPLHGRHH